MTMNNRPVSVGFFRGAAFERAWDGTLQVRPLIIAVQFYTDRSSIDCQHAAEVGLHENATVYPPRFAGSFRDELADASLEPKRNSTRSSSNRALLIFRTFAFLIAAKDVVMRDVPAEISFR
jgi:hypothetical protein